MKRVEPFGTLLYFITIEAWFKSNINFDCRYLELWTVFIYSLVFIVLNVRDEIESQYHSIVFLCIWKKEKKFPWKATQRQWCASNIAAARGDRVRTKRQRQSPLDVIGLEIFWIRKCTLATGIYRSMLFVTWLCQTPRCQNHSSNLENSIKLPLLSDRFMSGMFETITARVVPFSPIWSLNPNCACSHQTAILQSLAGARRVGICLICIISFNAVIWAVAWDFQQCGVCGQQRLRPACAYAQSDQSLC